MFLLLLLPTADTWTAARAGTATTSAVTSNGNPTTLNGRPTFTATVSSATAGTVTFYDGTTILGAGSTIGTAHNSPSFRGVTVWYDAMQLLRLTASTRPSTWEISSRTIP